MKILTIIVFVFIFIGDSYSQPVTQEWVVKYPAEAQGSMALDSSGNVLIVCWEQGNMTTIKYNNSSQMLWKRTYIPPFLTCRPKKIACDKDGNVYVAGSQFQYTIIKYDSSGNEKWIRTYSSPYGADSEVRDMTIDNNGNVYVTGQSWASDFRYGYVTIKYNSLGELLWSATYRGPGVGDFVRAIKVDNEKNVYLTGASDQITGNVYDMVSVKYDSNGLQKWVSRYIATSYGNGGSAISIQKELYIAGSTPINNYQDFLTIRYNKQNGDTVWVRTFDQGDSIANDLAKDIIVNENSEVFVAGDGGGAQEFLLIKYNSDATLAWSKITHGTHILTSMEVDVFDNIYMTGGYADPKGGIETVKYDLDGNLKWRLKYNSSQDMTGIKVLVNKKNDIFVYGGRYDTIVVIKYSQTTNIQSVSSVIPNDFTLFQNYPNPFNPSTTITFSLPSTQYTRLTVFDLLGREVAVLVNEKLNAGSYNVVFDGSSLHSGIYFYQLKAGDFVQTRKMLLIK